MASQYSLNLKAVLDTTQVKQELQKLRTLQQQALGNNQRGTSQNTQNLGNLNSLNSTLGKLNASISQLNNTVNKLNVGIGKINASNSKQSQQNQHQTITQPHLPIAISRPNSISVGTGGNTALSELGKFIQSSYDNLQTEKNNVEAIKRLKNLYNLSKKTNGNMNMSPAGWASAWFNTVLKEGLTRGQALSKAQTMYAGGITPLQTLFQNQHLLKSTFKSLNPRKITFENFNQAAGFGLMGLEQALMASSNYARATGDTHSAKMMQAGGTVTGMVGAGAAVGSFVPGLGTAIGAGVGAVIGGVIATFEYLAESSLEVAEAMAKLNEAVKQAGAIDRVNIVQSQQRNIHKQVEEGDIDALQAKRDSLQKEFDSILKQQTEIVPDGQLEAYAKKFEDLKKRFLDAKEESNFVEEWFGLEDAEIEEKLRQQYRKEKPQFEKNYDEYARLQTRKAEIQQEQTVVEQGLNALKTREKTGIAQTSGLKNILEDITRDDFIKSLGSTSRGELEKQLKIFENNAASSKTSYISNLQKAIGITGLSENDLKKREDLLTSADANKRDQLYNERVVNEIKRIISIDDSKIAASTQIDLITPLQDALSKLTPPSMENVNSLAGQGLMINRADDAAREQAMIDYEREQTELQRQIKDILQQDEHGSTESIIW